jgi:hypothetical protein
MAQCPPVSHWNGDAQGLSAPHNGCACTHLPPEHVYPGMAHGFVCEHSGGAHWPLWQMPPVPMQSVSFWQHVEAVQAPLVHFQHPDPHSLPTEHVLWHCPSAGSQAVLLGQDGAPAWLHGGGIAH